MARFEAEGALRPPPALVAASAAEMDSARVTDGELISTIGEVLNSLT